MTDLSPAAQAVLDAVDEVPRVLNCTQDHPLFAAAALRAAVDQVVPVELHPQVYENCCQYSDVQTRAGIRTELLAIADELDAA